MGVSPGGRGLVPYVSCPNTYFPRFLNGEIGFSLVLGIVYQMFAWLLFWANLVGEKWLFSMFCSQLAGLAFLKLYKFCPKLTNYKWPGIGDIVLCRHNQSVPG